jgi:hypothetical protein
MVARRALPLLLLAVAGCGGGDTTAGPAVVVRPGITAMAQAQPLACGTDRGVLEQALDAYTMLEGGPPADEAALVPDYLREPSDLFDVTPDGAVVPAAGSPC